MKRKWVFILGICLVIVFVLQIAFYLIFLRKYVGDNTSEDIEARQVKATIHSFLSICAKYNCTVIPVEREILLGFHDVGVKYFDHFVNLYDRRVMAFITFNEVFDSKIVVALMSAGFLLSSSSQPDAKLFSQNIITQHVLHHVFLKDHFAIHVIICYHRDGNFWWHGSFKLASFVPQIQHLFSVQDFHFAHHEGALDEFPLVLSQEDDLKLYLPRNITSFLNQLNHSNFIECNYTRSNLFYSKFKMDTSEAAMTFRALAWKILRLTKTTLDKLGIRFWLSSGTCLGYYRQCDIFPYGKDVDIGIWIKDYHPLIITGFLATGMSLKHKLGKVEDSLELSFIYEGVKLDIFFFYEEADHVWNGGLQTKTGNKYKYIFPKFNLCWTEFLGLKVSVPCETESYVVANYGPNWFQPVEKWDWKKSPFNVQFIGVWPEEEWEEVIQVADI